jgi:hypothetical protein
VTNGSFEEGLLGWQAWGPDPLSEVTCAAAALGGCSLKANGPAPTVVHQTLAISGRAGDSFQLRGHARAQQFNHQSNAPHNIFALVGRFRHVDGTESRVTLNFTPADHDWELREGTLQAPRDYKELVVEVAFQGHSGVAVFDGIELTR